MNIYYRITSILSPNIYFNGEMQEIYDFKMFEIDVNMLLHLHFMTLVQLRTEHVKLNHCMHILQHMKHYKQQTLDTGTITNSPVYK